MVSIGSLMMEYRKRMEEDFSRMINLKTFSNIALVTFIISAVGHSFWYWAMHCACHHIMHPFIFIICYLLRNSICNIRTRTMTWNLNLPVSLSLPLAEYSRGMRDNRWFLMCVVAYTAARITHTYATRVMTIACLSTISTYRVSHNLKQWSLICCWSAKVASSSPVSVILILYGNGQSTPKYILSCICDIRWFIYTYSTQEVWIHFSTKMVETMGSVCWCGTNGSCGATQKFTSQWRDVIGTTIIIIRGEKMVTKPWSYIISIRARNVQQR